MAKPLLMLVGSVLASQLLHPRGVQAYSAVADISEACAAPGAYCGNNDDGANCCSGGQYCQPWDQEDYQCVETPSQCSQQLSNVDFHGNDLGVKFGLNPWECCHQCTQTDNCVGYTFWNSHPSGPACYLKSSVVARKAAKGVVSGIVNGKVKRHVQFKIRSGEEQAKAANLGAWLVAERWMSWDSVLWKDVPEDVASKGEYTTMKYLGKRAGTRAFEAHRKTWITEKDIAEIAATGVLNTVRVPVGHWIALDMLDDMAGSEGDVYARGGLKYLDTLINDWAVKYNIAVVLSLHAHQGSQNGNDHSSPSQPGTINWSTSRDNVENSLQFATSLATRYKDSAAFLGMNLMNEPNHPVDRDILSKYFIDAYNRIRDTGNQCVILISTMVSEQHPDAFVGVMPASEYSNVWNEFHPYFIWGFEDVSEQGIIDYLGTYKQTHVDADPNGNRLFMGEWCMSGPNGAFQSRRRFHEFGRKQLAMWTEGAEGGYAFWSWRHSDDTRGTSPWSMRAMVRNGDLVLDP